MPIVKWDPWREIENAFDLYTISAGKGARDRALARIEGDWAPRVDIAETDDEFTIKAIEIMVE